MSFLTTAVETINQKQNSPAKHTKNVECKQHVIKKKKKTMDLLRNQRGNKKKKPGDKLQTKT